MTEPYYLGCEFVENCTFRKILRELTNCVYIKVTGNLAKYDLICSQERDKCSLREAYIKELSDILQQEFEEIADNLNKGLGILEDGLTNI